MALLADKNPTILDVAKRTDPDGKIATIAELLDQTNPMLTDMTLIEANSTVAHKSTVRTGLPQGIWRKLYQGVPTGKSTVAQVTDSLGMLEARSEVDKDLVELNGNQAAFRMSEAHAFIEGLNQQMMETVIYENGTLHPERFMGLAPRYSSLAAVNGKNIIDAGGAGSDNCSVWLIVWGPQTVFGIYPKGSKAGLQHEDLGLGDAFDGNGDRYRAYMDHWQWKLGLVLKDWRYAVRIANIDVSALVTETAAADLAKTMVKATHRIPQFSMGRAAFYVNRTTAQMLDIQSMEKGQNTLTSGNDTFGNPVTLCRGIPIRTVDSLLETEERIV